MNIEYPDYVKEGICWLMARRDSAARSIHGTADEEESLLKYICELRAALATQPSAEELADNDVICFGTGLYLTKPDGTKEHIPLSSVNVAQPSADAVECAREVLDNIIAGINNGDTGVIQTDVIPIIQQYGNARVAELTQRNAELLSALENASAEIDDWISHESDRSWYVILKEQIDAIIASQGGNGGR